MDIVEIEVCKGVEGPSVYINNYRVAGNKPWGGGRTLHSFKAKKSDIFDALKIAQILKEKDDEIERLRAENKRLIEERDRYSGIASNLLDKYFDSVTIRTTGEKE